MNTSESLDKLLPALIKAKAAFAPAIKNAQVSAGARSYKYVDLASVIDATEEALTQNDLVVLQGGEASEGVVPVLTLWTRLFHVSGQFLESHLTLPAGTPARFDAQTVGSAMTYARRYSYMAILGIAPEDEDGAIASSRITSEKEVEERLDPKIEQQSRKFSQQPVPESKLTRELKASIELAKRKTPVSEREDDLGITDEDIPDPIFEETFDQTPFKAIPRAVGPFISEAQSKRFYAIAMSNGKTKEDINEALRLIGATRSTEIPRVKYENMCAWAER